MRQKIRRTMIFISFLLFPVTIWYFSPYLIIQAASEHIMNGSFYRVHDHVDRIHVPGQGMVRMALPRRRDAGVFVPLQRETCEAGVEK